jgi:hypothetical protein
VDIMLYFGRKGRENLHELKVSHYAASTDDKGCVYIYSTYDELTKIIRMIAIQPMDARIVYQVCLYLLKHAKYTATKKSDYNFSCNFHIFIFLH